MYNKYFGFREKPFNVTPDPRFLFENESYQEAYANLLYGIRERKGFVILTGEAGTGKTTLLRRIMDSFEDTFRFVFFYNTTLSFEELLDHIFTELHLDPHSVDGRLKKIQALNHFLIAQLKQGGTVALLIDEAQNLSDEVLENLRLLSNLETAQEKLLQIVLVGQPELEKKLSQPQLRQLKQRIITWSQLNHLKENEVGPFLISRLRRAGYEGPSLFTEEAIQRITLYSKGIPRLINVICDNALLLTYAASQRMVSATLIEEAAFDLQLLSVSRKLLISERGRDGTQFAGEPISPLQEPAHLHPQTLPHKRKEPNPLTIPIQSISAQEPNGTLSIPFSSFLTRGIRFGLLLLLLVPTGLVAFGLIFPSVVSIFPESPIVRFTDRVALFAQTLNSTFSSLLTQTLGLEVQENLAASQQIVALRENPYDNTDVLGTKIIIPLSDNERLMDIAPIAKSPESDTNSVSETATPNLAADSEADEQSPNSIFSAKDFTRVLDQQNPTPPVTTPQDFRIAKEQTIRLQLGDTILNLVRQVYGSQNTLALVLIKEFNPHINDLDHVTAGTTILAPSLTEENLLRKQPNGSYRLLLAVFPRVALAQKHADLVHQYGYHAEVSPAKVAGSLLLYRVDIVELLNREAGQRAWNFVNVRNVLTVAPRLFANGKRTEE